MKPQPNLMRAALCLLPAASFVVWRREYLQGLGSRQPRWHLQESILHADYSDPDVVVWAMTST